MARTDNKALEEVTTRFLKDPNLWPRWPILPLKRYVETDGWGMPFETGYVYGDPQWPLQILGGNIWAPKPEDPILGTYETVDSVLDAGWVVD